MTIHHITGNKKVIQTQKLFFGTLPALMYSPKMILNKAPPMIDRVNRLRGSFHHPSKIAHEKKQATNPTMLFSAKSFLSIA